MRSRRSTSTQLTGLGSTVSASLVVIRCLWVSLLLTSCAYAQDEETDVSGMIVLHDALENCKRGFEARYEVPTTPPGDIADWLVSGLSGSEKKVFQGAGRRAAERLNGSRASKAEIREVAFEELVGQFEVENICGLDSGLSDLEMLGDVIFSQAVSLGVGADSLQNEAGRREMLADMAMRAAKNCMRE